MSAIAIVGANWGDEGKGKMTDFLAENSDVVVRFQGGNNAGHTIINDHGKFALHLLPSGVFYQHVVNILGPGMALDVQGFLKELDDLVARGVPKPVLWVSDRAQVVMPYHLLLDTYEEERLGERQFGSTQKGIAPFYADKYAKLGIQVSDLFDEKQLLQRIQDALVSKNVLFEHLYGKPKMTPDPIFSTLLKISKELRPFVCDTTVLIRKALASNKQIIVEGQLGALRDPDHGIYPFSTSSSPLAGYASVGAGLPPAALTKVVAVVKAYSSCVGEGPFVCELAGDEAGELRNRGGDAGEYGATTGRPRRVGWFDAVATRYGCSVQGATEMAITLLDVLGYLDQIPICTAYNIGGEHISEFPVTARLEHATPVYEYLPGWRCDISAARHFHELPVAAQDYVLRLEELTGIKARWISVGSRREATIER